MIFTECDNGKLTFSVLLYAGIGDILNQINQFLWVSDELGLYPSLYLGDERINRNGDCDDLELLTYLGLKDLFYEDNDSASFQEFIHTSEGEYLSMSELVELTKQKLKTEQRKVHYFSKLTRKNGDYSKLDISKLRVFECCKDKDDLIATGKPYIHPYLSFAIRNSKLASMVYENQSRKEYERILVHLRRGDVSAIQISHLEPILDRAFVKINKDRIFSITGMYENWDDYYVNAPKGHRSRYKTVHDIESKCASITETFQSSKCEVVLVSDGFTRISKAFYLEFKNVLLSGVSETDVEDVMSTELSPLLTISANSYVGESESLLLKVLEEGLSADYIISSSPSIFVYLSNALKLKIDYITV